MMPEEEDEADTTKSRRDVLSTDGTKFENQIKRSW
jgi:hypothetical protein